MNQYPIEPRTARPIQRHRMRSNRFSSSLFGARGSSHHARKFGYGRSALSLYRSGGSTGALGIASLSTRRACEMSVGYDELRSDEISVSGSGAWMRSRTCAASVKSNVVGLRSSRQSGAARTSLASRTPII
jgi:hypothetical protein